MRIPSLKHRKPRVYIFLSLFLFLSAFLCFESAVTGASSAAQSNALGAFLANFVNFFSGDVASVQVEPTGLSLLSDSTYLPNLGKKAQIGIGTTTRLQFEVLSETLKKGEYVNPAFSVTRGGKAQNGEEYFHIISDVSSHAVYLVSVGEVAKDCQIVVTAGENASYTYDFDIVDLPAPSKEICKGSVPDSLRLSVNETYTVPLKLDDGKKHSNYDSDEYLRRYYDTRKIVSNSSDSTICGIDEFGVIHAFSEGKATISYGPWKVNVEVEGNIPAPADDEEIIIDQTGNYLAINDYDYSNSGIQIQASFAHSFPDSSFTFQVVDKNGDFDPLTAKVIPLGAASCSVKGYRRNRESYLKIQSNANPKCSKLLPLTFSEIKPVKMDLFSGGACLTKEDSKNGSTLVLQASNAAKMAIQGSFFGENNNPNVTNKNLHVESDSDAIIVTGNDSSVVTLSFTRTGAANVRIYSEANPDLYYDVSFSISKVLNQDPNNTDFLSFVRKFFGHASLFAIDGIFLFLFLAFFLLDDKGLMSGAIALGGSFLLAGITEVIQLFTAGRTGSMVDVGIDTLGAFIGIVIALLIYCFVSQRKKKKQPLEKPSE